MCELKYIGVNLLEDEVFLSNFAEKFKAAGGVKVGDPVAYFEIDDKRYVYISYGVSAPVEMVKSDDHIVDIFEGLLRGSKFIDFDSGKYIALRTVDVNERDDRLFFFIRAVQVNQDA